MSEVNLDPIALQIGFALRQAQAAVLQDFNERFAVDDIRPAQYLVLKVLKHNPGLRQAQASAALGVKRTNFVPLFDSLEKRGLAERRSVAGDRRAFALHLTRKGEAMINALDKKAAAHEAMFVARIGKAQRNALLDLLSRLSDPALDK